MILSTKKRMPLIAGAALGVALVPLSTQLSAQEAWLEEIIITAQKRHETVQEVPIAISAFSEETIKSLGAQNINDLGRFTPGLETNNTQSTQPNFSIRGIKTDDFGIGTDPAVAVYVDGVYVGRSGGAQMNFNDIQRVEILRGPQGTLFGRNAAAGAISVITKKPTALTEGNLGVTVGNYNKVKLEGVYNTELVEGVYGRFGGLWNERDGYIDNDNPDRNGVAGAGTGVEDIGQEGNWSVTGSILWDLSIDTEIVWRAEYDEIDKDARSAYSVNPALYYNPANAPESFGDESGAYDNDYENDAPAFENRKLWGTSLTVNHDFDDDLSFISITSLRSFESNNRIDDDGTSIPGRRISTHNIEDNQAFSQEFRLSFHSDGAWSWSTGVSYFREEAEQEHRVMFGTDLTDLLLAAGLDSNNDNGVIPDDELVSEDNGENTLEFVNTNAGLLYGIGIPGVPSQAELLAIGTHTDQMFNELTFTSMAIYGDMTYTFTEQWDITFGLRYTRDSKDFDRTTPVNKEGFAYRLAFGDYENSNGLEFLEQIADTINNGAPLPGAPTISHSDSPSDTWSEWTPRMVLNYHMTTDMLTYLSLARGFKAGGYGSVGFSDTPFEQEIVDNAELGYKSTWLDSRLRFNVALFYYEYSDLQIQSFVKVPGDSISRYHIGNGDAKAFGLETEIQWLVLDSLMLSFNSAYLDTEYVDYTKQTSIGELVLDGQPMSDTPKNAYNIGAEYTLTMGEIGDLIMRFDTNYTGERIDNSGETKKTVDAYSLTNARVTYVHVSGEWELALWAENLFDKEYLLGAQGGLGEVEGNSPYVIRGTPRFWGFEYRQFF